MNTSDPRLLMARRGFFDGMPQATIAYINVFYTVNNWSSCNMWVFTINIPFHFVG
ncbi:MAG: hypothetical protein ACOYOT_00445 [Bacteroidales bacterium]